MVKQFMIMLLYLPHLHFIIMIIIQCGIPQIDFSSKSPWLQISKRPTRFIELSSALNHKVNVGYVFRFSPAFLYFKNLLKTHDSPLQNVILESHSYLPFWRKNKNHLNSVSSSSRLGGGVLRELSHELDLIIHLFGYPRYISAKTETRGMTGIDVEHSCVSFCFHPKGSQYSYPFLLTTKIIVVSFVLTI